MWTKRNDAGGSTVVKRDLDVQGDYINRDQLNILQQFIIQIGDFRPPTRDIEALRADYLRYIREAHERLDFRGIAVVEAVEKAAGLSLLDVYVPVQARWERPEGETWQRLAGRMWRGDKATDARLETDVHVPEPVSVEEVLQEQAALVILGDPGAGKSTLLKYLALNLARREDGPLPILIPLNAYGKALLEEAALSLDAYLTHYFGSRQDKLKDLGPLFQAALEQGRAVVLLDGLDEVATERGRLVKLVEDFVRAHLPVSEDKQDRRPPSNRVIVTSRFVGYREAPLCDPRWKTYALADWTAEEIERFVSRFTRAVERALAGGELTSEAEHKATREQGELLAALSVNEGLQRLAGNPLLLTILVLIKRQGVRLPDRRVELYELYLETLLRSWNQARALDSTPVGPNIEYHDLWYVLAALGLWLRETSPQSGLVSESQMRDYLVRYYQEQEELSRREARMEATAFMASVHQYSSLLVERGRDQYGFIHLTFEEYLAACGLSILEQPEALRTIVQHQGDPAWHETLLLTVGVLGIVRKDRRAAAGLLEALLNVELLDQSHGAQVLLAGEALRDVGAGAVGPRAAARVTEALVQTMQRPPETQPSQRRAAGLILGDIGWRPADLDAFVVVEPEEFLYGDEKRPRRIGHRYWIAKYPVANAQYARFIEDAGYHEDAPWWDAPGRAWLQNAGRQEPYFWGDRERSNLIFPVVGVTWHEACAYCRWLHEQVSAQGFAVLGVEGRAALLDGYTVRLPREEEWERAARGTDGRAYPWGDAFEPTWANTDEGGIGDTTAVCTYPQNESACGAWDTAGNVWEWTSSAFDKETRVLRGGSWVDPSWDARCAARLRFAPGLIFSGDLGFRLVVSLAEF